MIGKFFGPVLAHTHDIYGLGGEINLHRVECGVQSGYRRLGRVERSYTVSSAPCALLFPTILL